MRAWPDERLRLVFTCCHPALAPEAQVALTLRTLGGLTTRRDGAGVPGARADDGPAPGPGEAQDPRGGHPVPRAAGARCCRSGSPACSRCCTWCSTRGTRRPRGTLRPRATCATRRSGSARLLAGCCPTRARPRAAGPDAAAGRAAGRRASTTTARSCCSRTRTARRGTAAEIAEGLALVDARAAPAARPGPYASRPRSPPCHADRAARRRHRLAADRRAVRRAAPAPAVAGGRAQPRRRGRDGRRPAGRAGAGRRARRDGRARRATTCCPRPAPTCCAGSAAASEAAAAYRRALELATNPAERRFLERRLRRGHADVAASPCEVITPARMLWLLLGFQLARTNRLAPSGIRHVASNP